MCVGAFSSGVRRQDTPLHLYRDGLMPGSGRLRPVLAAGTPNEMLGWRYRPVQKGARTAKPSYSSSSLVRLMNACKTVPPPTRSKPPVHHTKWCMRDGNCGFLRFCAHGLLYHLVIVSIRARSSLDTRKISGTEGARGKRDVDATSVQSRALRRLNRSAAPCRTPVSYSC